MPRSKNNKVYAVRQGREPGIFYSWDEARQSVEGFRGAEFKGFTDLEEARHWLGQMPSAGSAPSGSSTRGGSTAPQQQPAQGGQEPMYESGTFPGAPQYVYVDGSSINNGREGAAAGIGVLWGDLSTHSERLPGSEQTNNRAELYAVIRALELDPYPTYPMYLWTDSEYTINCLTKWHTEWKANGWRLSTGKPVQNLDLIKYALALMDEKDKACKEDFGFVKVEGHSGDPYNDRADRAAKAGAGMPPVPSRDFARDLARLQSTHSTPSTQRAHYYTSGVAILESR